MQLKSQQKIYLHLIIFSLIICLILILVILPLINRVKAKSQVFQQEQRTLFLLREKKNYLTQLQTEAQISQTNLDKVKGVFLQPEQAIDFIMALESIASLTANQQEIQILSPTKEKTKIERPTLSFQLSLWGSFPNLIRFLIYLENMDYLVQVEQLRIRRLSQQDLNRKKLANLLPGDIETKMNIVVYTQ